jgi:hypothetical protein
MLKGVCLENIVVDGLRVSDAFITWACVFRHVTLRGVIGRIIVNSNWGATGVESAQLREFDDANAAYYESVDWALDISEGKFVDLDIRGIPAALIKRDPVSQVVVRREKVMEGKWRELDLAGTHWRTALELFLKWGHPDDVLVAPKRSAKYKILQKGLDKLREAGVAEPD